MDWIAYSAAPSDSVSGHKLVNKKTGKCLDSSAVVVKAKECNASNPHELWRYGDGHVRVRDGRCLDEGGDQVHIWKCETGDTGVAEHQHWKYDPETGLVRHVASDELCLECAGESVSMQPCNAANEGQEWKIQAHTLPKPTAARKGSGRARGGGPGGVVAIWLLTTTLFVTAGVWVIQHNRPMIKTETRDMEVDKNPAELEEAHKEPQPEKPEEPVKEFEEAPLPEIELPEREEEGPFTDAQKEVDKCLNGGLTFTRGTWTLAPASRERAAQAGAVLVGEPQAGAVVVGYTARPSGSWSTQARCRELSLRRAQAVREILDAAGCSGRVAASGAGYADERGPRCDMVLCDLDTVQRVESAEAEAAVRSRELEMHVKFDTGMGFKAVVFTKLPLGLAFDVAVTDVEPGGQADELGVEVGWTFVSVNGEELAGKDWSARLEIIKNASALLPQGE